jgi:hypothetical protein
LVQQSLRNEGEVFLPFARTASYTVVWRCREYRADQLGGSRDGELALLEGLRAMDPWQREAFWAKLRSAKEERAQGAAAVRSSEAGANATASRAGVRRRAQGGGNYSVGACLGYPTPPSMQRNADTGTLDLVMEVDDGSDLNILASHVAKVLLEEVIGFRVDLRSRADSDKAMERLALERRYPDSVDINMGVMAEAKTNVAAYNKFVQEESLLIDLGPTGYSVQSGWFTQDRVSPPPVAGPTPTLQLTADQSD